MQNARRELSLRAGVLFGSSAAMWLVMLLDWVIPGRSAAGHGIVPRTSYGLEGIPIAPLIHSGFEHLVANTIPFLILGAIILARGISEFMLVSLVTLLTSGSGTWLFGEANTEHIGASGIVFGFFGYLVFRAVFDRRVSSILIMLAVALWYGGTMLYSLVPAEGISWTGHFFGFAGGLAAARLRHPRLKNAEKVKRALSVIPIIKPK